MTACCTCAILLANINSSSGPRISSTSEKPVSDRTLECCSRIICADCIDKNPRFLTYCPYCQPSGRASSTSSASSSRVTSPPPYPSSPYTPPTSSLTPQNKTPSLTTQTENLLSPLDEKSLPSKEPIAHYLLSTDSIPSLSLLYNIPAQTLRKYNNLATDTLLFARQTIYIPPGHISKSPRPPESDAELLRKSKIRKWMMTTKESDYDVAVMYLNGTEWDLEEAVERYKGDLDWERMNPPERKEEEKRGGGGWFFGLGW
ncbi:hypothetical protein QBC38DRAFT_455033 [Podospora fimiseda]|uniref:LysM domain-containing protein n=1 Tax=Podospora fimiseda TaxID=252190 RepID=A0AAN7GZI3_9PEZI|nr:hypothetical protein QBC38DRAFT_455033 [Podospora fimiseda]